MLAFLKAFFVLLSVLPHFVHRVKDALSSLASPLTPQPPWPSFEMNYMFIKVSLKGVTTLLIPLLNLANTIMTSDLVVNAVVTSDLQNLVNTIVTYDLWKHVNTMVDSDLRNHVYTIVRVYIPYTVTPPAWCNYMTNYNQFFPRVDHDASQTPRLLARVGHTPNIGRMPGHRRRP